MPIVGRVAHAKRVALAGALAIAFGVIPRVSARAQRIDGLQAGVRARVNVDTSRAAGSDFSLRATAAESPLAARLHAVPKRFAPLMSAILPGSGQYVLGDDRSVVYAAIELLGWVKYAKDSREKAQQEGAFRDIARRIARANFSTTLPDGDWTYYEAMRDWLASGEYSLSGTDLVPETDPNTFNGYTWLVAQSTTSSRAQALIVYAQKAAHPDFRWSWVNAQLQFDIYKRTTENRNDAAHAMTQDLTIIGLNHVISLVDAFATFRLQVRPQADGRTAIGASLPW